MFSCSPAAFSLSYLESMIQCFCQARNLKKSTMREKQRGNLVSTIMELPDPILMDILSRLPAKSIFSCRCVCKSWRNILLDPHFAKFHVSRAPVEFFLKSEGTVFLAELDEESCISNSDVHLGRKSLMSCKTSNGINIGLKEIELCNSCEGMLCVRRSKRWSPYNIYNPITGEHVVVKQTVRASFTPIDCSLGFSRKTNEFKVMRFLVVTQSRTIVKGLEVDIQTVGSNSWRSIGETPYWPHLSSISSSFLNGALHWICYAAQIILAFDFDEENFQSIPTPSQHRQFLPYCRAWFVGGPSLYVLSSATFD
ncbi:hypothetical protein RJ639_029238 [Escallonia herrerae]|uniref:F-box domain-containing protein n=1 Tax=Escallonia herrerae TaxID=1293975 RepID=A0AA88X6D8_9ASTE|nr:hypothetical protein RJ639_029238 [Escallonia herrerae]